MNGQPSLLVVDDEEIACHNLAHAFRKEGYEITLCHDGATALKKLQQRSYDLLLTDLRMPGIDGMALLESCQRDWPETRVIMLTGFATLDSAVAAMKAGAYHYLAKPFRLDEVRELVSRALAVQRLERENHRLRKQVETLQSSVKFMTQNPTLLAILDTARRIAATPCSVLITGESGTGKELLTRYIHQQSLRQQAPFVAINCGALQDDLLANELFGHEKGAFTGAHTQRKGLIEIASGGTLFLDEIGETSMAMQIKLLRVIDQQELLRVGGNQTVKIDVRFLAATNRNLAIGVEEGRFRRDLYYRLNVVELHIPPLTERRDDIPLLANYLLHRQSAHLGRLVDLISPETMALLTQYHYPGNVRELANIIERGVALAEGHTLEPHHLPEVLRHISDKVADPQEESSAALPTLE
ncbi:MAG: sigma-54-dependent Fis family transcriptional regulator, partial [Gammaproteobacteria bacterium]|nr:sigma-54-dependent Fis family transcriptional regulator [Gammaproteobacteria bacterium]